MTVNADLDAPIVIQGKPLTILVVLVNWRRAADTVACVGSLVAALAKYDPTVVICENGSGDGSDVSLREYFSRQGTERQVQADEAVITVLAYGDNKFGEPRCLLVLSETNRGFAGGNNLAYRVAVSQRQFDYVWFLNNDTEVEPDTLSQMIGRMEQDSRIGICGSTLIYAHDRKTVQALGGATYQSWTGMLRELGHGQTWPCAVDQAEIELQLSYVSGASMLTSAKFLREVGLMSEDYFLYYEEVDWAVRARRAGFCLGYAATAVVYHKEGSALGSGKNTQRSALAEFYGLRNRLVFTRKFFPWALPSVTVMSWLQVVKRITQGQWVRARLMATVLLGLQREAPGR